MEEVGADPGRLRIAFSVEAPDGYNYAPDCIEAVRETARLCESLGHDVEEAWPDFIDREELYHQFSEVAWGSIAAQVVDGWARSGDPNHGPLRAVHARPDFTAADLLNAMESLARQLGLFQEPYDAWIAPTLSEPPLPLGSFGPPPTRCARTNSLTSLAVLTRNSAM